MNQLGEIVELITKEEYLENEEKIEKALAKSIEEHQQEQQQKQKQIENPTEQQDPPRQGEQSEEPVSRPQPQFAEGQLSEINILPISEDEKHILKSDKTIPKVSIN